MMFRSVLGLSIAAFLAQQALPSPGALSDPEQAQVWAILAQDEEAQSGQAGADRDVLTYARKMAGLRVRPSAIDRLWAIEPPARDLEREWAQASKAGTAVAWLKSLGPAGPEYEGLVQAYRRYAALAAKGGWSALPAGPTFKEGDASPSIILLRTRLTAEGYPVPDAGKPDVMDTGVTAALRLFQQRHGLEPDGKLGPGARQALNVSADARRDQIEANLERMRWMPRNLPPDRLEVDTGWQEATYYRAGKTVLNMRVIVGKPSTKTPMFASQLEAVVFNPPWNVPAAIARAEILPKAARDPGYWTREGFIQTDHGVQQKPGPRNALGLIKFDLPSPFGVYLHDTPSRSLFAQPQRALSHGCMRLEKPKELAQLALGWPAERVDQAIAAGDTRRTPLPAAIPLFVVYRTVAVDSAGATSFHADTYGWDQALTQALRTSGGVKMADQPHVTECSVQARP